MSNVKNTMSQINMIWLADAIRRVCVPIDGFAHYEDEWTDERIVEEAEKASIHLTIHNVRGMRERLVGNLRKQKITLDVLVARISELEAWAGKRTREPFKRGNGAAK